MVHVPTAMATYHSAPSKAAAAASHGRGLLANSCCLYTVVHNSSPMHALQDLSLCELVQRRPALYSALCSAAYI